MTVDLLETPSTLPDIVNALAISPDFERDGVCFAARNSALYVSSDAGESWHEAYHSLPLQEALTTVSVAVSPTFASDRTVFAGVVGGVLRSSDGGVTWQVATFPDPPPVVTTLAVSPAFERDGVVFAGTMEDGIFRSADRGSSWGSWNFGLLDLNVLCLAVSPDFEGDETLFLGTGSGLFRSTNGGRAWREVELPVACPAVLSISFAPHQAHTIYVGTEGEGLWLSDDDGRSWKRIGQQAVIGAVNAILLTPEAPSSPEILLLLNDQLLHSHDGGGSWEEWHKVDTPNEGIAAVAAPQGLTEGAPLLLGTVEQGVLCLKI